MRKAEGRSENSSDLESPLLEVRLDLHEETTLNLKTRRVFFDSQGGSCATRRLRHASGPRAPQGTNSSPVLCNRWNRRMTLSGRLIFILFSLSFPQRFSQSANVPLVFVYSPCLGPRGAPGRDGSCNFSSSSTVSLCQLETLLSVERQKSGTRQRKGTGRGGAQSPPRPLLPRRRDQRL